MGVWVASFQVLRHNHFGGQDPATDGSGSSSSSSRSREIAQQGPQVLCAEENFLAPHDSVVMIPRAQTPAAATISTYQVPYQGSWSPSDTLQALRSRSIPVFSGGFQRRGIRKPPLPRTPCGICSSNTDTQRQF